MKQALLWHVSSQRTDAAPVTRGTRGTGLCLKWRGAIGAVPERLHSGHRGCESGWGRRFLAAGDAVGAGVGVWESLWGRVSAVGRGEGGTPPPLQAIPGQLPHANLLKMFPQCLGTSNVSHVFLNSIHCVYPEVPTGANAFVGNPPPSPPRGISKCFPLFGACPTSKSFMFV